jgi:O-antigen ligase
MYQISNKTNTASLEIHMKDISTGVSSFLKSPIVGHGIGNYADSYMQFGGGAGLSSGVLAVAAQGGVLLLIIYLAPLFLGARQAFEERKLNIAVSICISTASFFAIILDNNTLFALALAFYLSYYFEASRKS